MFLKNSDTLKNYGVDAEIVELPGHTKGSIGIKIGTSDFIVGDALINIFYPTKALLYGNFQEMKKSANYSHPAFLNL